MWLSSHIKVRSHQGQSKISISLQILCSPYFLQAGGLHSTECVLARNHFLSCEVISIRYKKFQTNILSQFYQANKGKGISWTEAGSRLNDKSLKCTCVQCRSTKVHSGLSFCTVWVPTGSGTLWILWLIHLNIINLI